MSISKKSNLNGWHKNTELCVNVKTMLLSDVRMKVGKSYQGVLRRDVECEDYRYDEQFTFVETLPWLFALGVYNETLWALEGLIGEE